MSSDHTNGLEGPDKGPGCPDKWLGGHSQTPQTQGLNPLTLISHDSGGRGPRAGCLHGWGLGRIRFLACRRPTSGRVPTWWRERIPDCSSSHQGTHPTPVTSSDPDPLQMHDMGVRSSAYESGGHFSPQQEGAVVRPAWGLVLLYGSTDRVGKLRGRFQGENSLDV